MQKLQDIQRAMELLSTCQGPAKNIDEATKHKYQFWDTQPVPKLSTFLFQSELKDCYGAGYSQVHYRDTVRFISKRDLI